MDNLEIERCAKDISEALSSNAFHRIDITLDMRLGTVVIEANSRPSYTIACLIAAGGNLFEYSSACIANFEISMRNPWKNNTILKYTESLIVK